MHAPRKNLAPAAVLALAALAACQGSSGGIVTSGDSSDEELAAAVLTTTAVGSLATTGVALTTAVDTGPSVYLQNRREIGIALARGSGPWVEDVADELGLPEGLVPYLGAALKRYRDPLAKLLENGVGKVRVDDWERTLGAALCCDPWIRPFAHQRFGCTNAHVVECLP